MVSVTVMIKEEPTTSSELADADELEAVLVHVTRPSAQIYLRSLITNLRKEGTSLQSTLTAVRPEDSTSSSPANTKRAASPPKEITPVTKPTAASAAQHESPEDIAALIYEDSQRRKREATEAAVAAANEKEISNASSAPMSEHEGLETQDKTDEEKQARTPKQRTFLTDLDDIPLQPPIPKEGRIKEGASKYKGVAFHKAAKKWSAYITMNGKKQHIGVYDNEERAAVDHARAVFKYRSEERAKAREERSFILDLSDVPPQPPILKEGHKEKEGGSRYKGVYFHKATKKWIACITIDGKNRHIGIYDNEDKAAVDYARAVFKYRSEERLEKAPEKNLSTLDLSDVSPKPPIPRSAGQIKHGGSQYKGVYFLKAKQKWLARITISGELRYIGSYDDEEEAAIDYARAVFKYRSERKQSKAPMQCLFLAEMSDVPPQPPIRKEGRIKEGSSKYVGVAFHKAAKKWSAQIVIDGKKQHIGIYDNEEEAAVGYARAVFKYRGEGKQKKALLADLSDIPPQPLILKEGHKEKEGTSKYAGVCFDKSRNKWMARIRIDSKKRHIGYYDNDEEAAADYARAVFKYRNEKKAETEKTQNAPETAKRKQPPCAEDEEKADAPKRLKNAEKDNCNHMQAIKLEEDCCW